MLKLLGRKKKPKNHYKSRVTKRRSRIVERLWACLKVLTGTVALLFISFVFIFGYAYLTQCDYFKTESVVVTGLNRLTEKEILKQTDIEKGKNLLSINLSTARKRLLAHSWISDAEVSRELPSKLSIRIKEHEPIAILDLGRRFLINVNGEIFKERVPSDPGDLPLITGLEYSDLYIPEDHLSSHGNPGEATGNADRHPAAVGQDCCAPFSAVMDVLALGQNPECILPNRLIKRIQVDKEIGLTLYAAYYETGRIRAIKLGYNNYPGKFNLLRTIFSHMEKNDDSLDFDSIDLINVNRIVVNPIKIQPPAEDQKEV